LSDHTNHQNLPTGLIDALNAYAIDPVNWETLAQELDRSGDLMGNVEPGALLAALSRAEALAWQLKGQPEAGASQSNCTCFLIDDDQRVETASEGDALEEYCHISNGRLVFNHPQSEVNYKSALVSLQEGANQALVELKSNRPYCRYGYLVPAANLPAALKHTSNQSLNRNRYGLLVANAQTGDRTSTVLQSSFGLTAAEIAVCKQLTLGMKLKELAQNLNISPNTARNHLQSIFEKTHINRQGDLILMMTQISVILSMISTSTVPLDSAKQERPFPPYQFILVGGEHYHQPPDQPAFRKAPTRRVAYRRYGSGSKWLVYFHESVGSSRLPRGTEQLCEKLDLSILAAERPGTGFSDAQEGYNFESVAQDMETLLNQLNIEEVSLLGYLSGGGYAISCAAHLRDRVQQLMLVSARGSSGLSHKPSSPLTTLKHNLTMQPWLLSTFFSILRNRANPDTNRKLLERVYGSAPQDKNLLQSQPELLEHLVDISLESLTISAAGVVGEIRNYAEPAPVDLNQISAPTIIWHGDQDQLASYEALENELQGIQFESRIFAGWGSLILHRYWSDILALLAARQNNMSD
jgi:pimeloyl-ACP methyl ester carboxylesterase/DNA-binding CsgD family transcriptional regulator